MGCCHLTNRIVLLILPVMKIPDMPPPYSPPAIAGEDGSCILLFIAVTSQIVADVLHGFSDCLFVDRSLIDDLVN